MARVLIWMWDVAGQHVAQNLASVGSITDLVDHLSNPPQNLPHRDRWFTVRYQKLLHMLVPTFPSFALLDLCFTEILPFFA